MTELNNIYHSAPLRVVVISFIITLFIDLIPITLYTHIFLPQLTILLMMFWLLHRPQNIGIGVAFTIGLVLDIATGSLMGMHCLGLIITAFIIQRQQRQILLYSFGIQSFLIFMLLLMIQVIWLFSIAFTMNEFIGWSQLIIPPLGALLWPLLNSIMFTIANQYQHR